MRKGQGKRYGYGLIMGWLVGMEVMTACGAALGKTPKGDESEQPTRIHVRVFNVAQVPDQTLIRAENLAGAIFHAAGVELSWTNCQLPEDTRCADPLDPTHLGMRLLPDIGPEVRSSDRTMGYAVGCLASVSLRRAREDAGKSSVLLAVVLGPVLAHEIGHLLLGAESHSPTGIMRARWQAADYHPPAVGALLFTPEQAQTIRSEVRKRAEREAGTGIATATARN